MSMIYIFPDDFELNTEKIDITKIKLSDTVIKKKSNSDSDIYIFNIDIFYKNKPIYIQLPIYKIKSISENILEIIVDSLLLNLLIKPLEEHIINLVYNKSEKFFKKNFTLNKIINSLIQINIENCLNIKVTKNSVFFNRYKSIIELKDCNSEDDIVCLIKIDSLEFLKNKFTFIFKLQQGKVFNDKEEIINNYSIISV